MSRSKRFTAARAKVDKSKTYNLDDAIKLLRETAGVKFNASVEVHINTGIDPKKGDQIVRGSVDLPHGTGKTLKIAAFVNPDKEKDAKAGGADIVGGKDLIEQIKKDQKCDFDIAVAVPEIMKDLAVIARTLGQKGLMPNPKAGTVSSDIKKTVTELKKGKANFKNDDTANIHQIVGKLSFSDAELKANIAAFLDAVKRSKPDSIKGTFIRTITLNSTMGPGIRIQM